MKGTFITLEGCEGSGKTTIINKLKEEFEKKNIKYIVSREPGGSKIAEEIRKVILNKENTEMDYMTEALLYAASRSQHLKEVIIPHLEDGFIVICDRFIDSSLAYQGKARGLGIDNVYNINYYATKGILPDLTIYIDIPVEVGLKRISDNNRDVNRLDLEKISFHETVRNGYLEICEKYKDRIVKVDGNRDIDSVFNDVKKIVFDRL